MTETEDKITDELKENLTKEDQPENPPPAKPEKKEAKPPLKVGGKLMGIIPQDLDEAWRLIEAMYRAGMTPNSYEVMIDQPGQPKTIDVQATKARLMIGVMKGMEVGLPPVTALSTICIINNKPCLWGDGAVALVQKSGKVEYIKSYYEGEDETAMDYTAHYIVKRKDQDEPYHRTFSMGDAKRANLLGKKGPWAYGYAKRMLMMRAQAWALRDSSSDLLMGIGIAEEVQDYQTVEGKREETSLTSLDDDFTPDQPAALEDKSENQILFENNIKDKEPATVPAQGSLLSNAE